MDTPSASSQDAQPSAIFIMGPTATGKSDAALALARRWPVEIISVDSAMVYRGMDIGTAKPTVAERASVPHHLIDLIDPEQNYSAADFRTDALSSMQAVTERGHIPLLVGGTLLYFRALTQGLAPLPGADRDYRAALDREANEIGWAKLHERLAAVDPEAAQRIHPNDAQRIQRALEVHYLTGKAMSAHWQQPQATLPYRTLRLALVPGSRVILRERIAKRFEAMMAAGFVDEVAALRARPGLTAEHPAMRAVGYRQLWAHLDGQCSRDEAIANGIVATRRYAKRQMTWLRSETDVQRVDADAPNVGEMMYRAVKEWLEAPK